MHGAHISGMVMHAIAMHKTCVGTHMQLTFVIHQQLI